MHVRTREGRVVKPEGNPSHPVSRGGLCPRGQSAPQGLYDPDRVRRPLRSSGGQRTEEGGQKAQGSAASRPLPSVVRNPSAVPLEQLAAIALESGFEPVPWAQALDEAARALKKARRLFLVSDLQTGALAEVMQQFHRAVGLPGAVAFYEAFDYEPLRTANEKLFGRAVIPRYRLQECDFILSLGAEFLESWISNVEFAWQFARMHHGGPADRGPQSFPTQIAHRQTPDREDPARAYPLPPEAERPTFSGEMAYLGPRLSMTAANADYFLQVPAGQESAAALALLQEVARRRGRSMADFGWQLAGAPGGAEPKPASALHGPQLQEIAGKLAEARNPVVLAGPVGATGLAAERLALIAMQLNQAVGAIGRTVDLSQTHALGGTTPPAQLEEMLQDLGPDDALIVHQANPAYSLPRLRPALERAGTIVYMGPMLNETARLARWVLPTSTPLEEWGDYAPWSGIHCLIQPMMGMLHDTRSCGDILLALAADYDQPLQRDGQTAASFLDWLRLRWRQLQQQMAPHQEFDAFWRQALQRGGAFPQETESTSPQGDIRASAHPIGSMGPVESASIDVMHLWLWPSIMWFDGRLANRGWLQEVPERMSTLTWGSWVDISPATARRLKVRPGDVLAVSNPSGTVKAPARITPEVADNLVALALGQGHTALGLVAAGRGMNGFELLARQDAGSLFGIVELRATGEQAPLIGLSATQDQHKREILRWTSPQELRRMHASEVEEVFWPGPAGYQPQRDLYPPHEYPKHRWAMVIDLDRCIGCGACTVACYAENNIPVMGPRPLLQGREMSWLRVPPYKRPGESRRTGFLPLPCQHCDAAPCEPVCPVFAAVHNEQGLNAQIYNRCIGTRYCSNNCPYKVRRFEWFNPHWREPLPWQLNPDVTVRCRGVMEKCTFCIQRIHYHQRQARAEGRPLREGEIQPACVQSCPTRALVFGDLMRPDSEVYQLFHHTRRYQLLKELNTKPAVVYLKRIAPDEPGESPVEGRA
jgi:Fe-S-cluster-containing dehydrogenase component/anaerobic selenocysteine-containing dehydrogenase